MKAMMRSASSSVEALRGLGEEIAEEVDEVLRLGRVGHPTGYVALVHVEGGEQHGGPVQLVLELPMHRCPGDRRAGRVDP